MKSSVNTHLSKIHRLDSASSAKTTLWQKKIYVSEGHRAPGWAAGLILVSWSEWAVSSFTPLKANPPLSYLYLPTYKKYVPTNYIHVKFSIQKLQRLKLVWKLEIFQVMITSPENSLNVDCGRWKKWLFKIVDVEGNYVDSNYIGKVEQVHMMQ